ncbi:MAG: hypothetical protein WD270_01275 [Acetobacterales bacterium]
MNRIDKPGASTLPPGEAEVRLRERTPDGRKIWEVRRNGVVETHVTSRASVKVIERTAKRFERVLKRLAER